jgi:hypothetical protein
MGHVGNRGAPAGRSCAAPNTFAIGAHLHVPRWAGQTLHYVHAVLRRAAAGSGLSQAGRGVTSTLATCVATCGKTKALHGSGGGLSGAGAGGQARTDDLLFTKQLLYQLSYTGAMIL